MDGLWSSCGDERIIVFTTNHKDQLDPALLRPGRMDVHVHMSYCTMDGFKILASNYLNIEADHQLYRQIEGLLENVEVTPAEIAEELLKSGGPDVVLGGLVKFLEQKTLQKAKAAELKELLKSDDNTDVDVEGTSIGITLPPNGIEPVNCCSAGVTKISIRGTNTWTGTDGKRVLVIESSASRIVDVEWAV